MANLYYSIDTSKKDYPLLANSSFYSEFNAGEELKKQINHFFPDMINFNTIAYREGKKSMREELLMCKFNFRNSSDNSFYIYAFQIEGGGRPSSYPKEQRIQVRQHSMWKPDLNTLKIATNYSDTHQTKQNKECYIVGIYKTGPMDDDVVFCAYHPIDFAKFETNGNSPVSKQVGIDSIREAYLHNISLYESNNGKYKVINFKPQNLFWYMANRDQLHLDDIKKAEELIKKCTLKEENNTKDDKNLSLQKIFYGAPGTGKSHEVKKLTGELSNDEKDVELENVFRTIFHPDSDYASFVGCYKPSMRKTGKKHQVDGKDVDDEEIVYEFVPQTFTDAYVFAYKNPEKQTYLVIEEINRGNCAQIFGDLFQLLDRDVNGVSEYKIKADKDLAKYLKEELGKDADGIKNEKLCLPTNLNIVATMNTSDQSLFPMDSAFKRRWDWVYVPISDAKKNYFIEIDNSQYDWWGFLSIINGIIDSTIHSEDKKLGYFFTKAYNGKITADTFVNKVIFYLWNDVFKDYEPDNKAFKDSNGDKLVFHKFFREDGSTNTDVVIKFLQDLEVDPFENPDDGSTVQNVAIPNNKRQYDKSRYSVNGNDDLNKAQMTREAFKLYIDAHPNDDAQTIANAWKGLGLENDVRHLVETEAEFQDRTKNSNDSNKRAVPFKLSNDETIYLSTQFGIGNIDKFKDAVNNAGWNIRIEKQA